jgi:hypothetical protein
MPGHVRLRFVGMRYAAGLASTILLLWLVWFGVNFHAGDPAVLPASGASAPTFLLTPGTQSEPQNHAALLALIKERSSSSRLFANDAAIETARAQSTLFATITPEMVRHYLPLLTERQKADDRMFIQYDTRRLASRVEGDTINVNLPGLDSAFKAVITRVQTVDGALRWSGYLADFHGSSSFTISHAGGDGQVEGVVVTPMGGFSLEAKNGYGWIISDKSTIDKPIDPLSKEVVAPKDTTQP